MKRVIRIGVIVLVVFAILYLSTFGCNFFTTSTVNQKPRGDSVVDRLKEHVFELSYEIGNRNIADYDNLEKAENYITEQFKSYRYDVKFQEYVVENRRVKNIIVTKEGVKFPQEVIIV